MHRVVFSFVVTAALLSMAVVPVNAQEIGTTISGTIDSVSIEADETSGETTVVVTLTNDLGESQTVRLTAETAESLGLVVLMDEDGDPATPPTVSVSATLPETIVIDSSDVLTEEEDKEHPVGSALADFFGSLFDVDYDLVMEYHEDGTGFGVIAQALWMTNALEGNSDTFQAILDAKKSGDFSAITLPDGSTPTNWGQFRKAVMDDMESAKQNLGAVMSRKAEKDAEPGNRDDINVQVNPKDEKDLQGKDEVNSNNNGNGDHGNNGGGENNNKNNSKDKDKGKDKGNGKNK
ncbi:MAG: hypothetical protein FJZ87_04420 [Chloroflexi bacterium]|nr:hypothetical protein [Chloroflexota bacterium]